jgi:hypothetical protein
VNVLFLYNLVFTIFFFLIAYFIIRWFFEHNSSEKATGQESASALSLINSISICAVASLFILGANEMNLRPLVLYDAQILLVMFVASLVYQRFHFTTYEKFKWGLFAGFAAALFIYFVIWNEIPEIRIIRKLKIGIIYSIVLLVLFFILDKLRLNFERLKTAGIPIFFGMACMAVFLELTTILNQHGIYIVNRSRWAKIIYIFLAFICLVIHFLKLHRKRSWEDICYLGFIISIAGFTQLPPLSITATSELFEQANHGMLTYSFFNFGSIPILESFDGHMLKVSFGGLIYGLLNGHGALGIDSSYFFYSFANLLNCIIVFYLLKNIFSKEFSLLVILFIPLNYSDFFVLTVVMLIYCVKKDTISGYLLYLFSIALTALYELPPAAATGLGTFITLMVILLPDVIKQKRITAPVRRFLIAGCVFILSTLCVYFLLCLLRQINPISRLREILGIVNSNNNWAYSSIGNQNQLVFYIGYFILPAIIVAALICILYKLKTNIKANTAAITVISLSIGYFANYSRMLGRHSFAEGGMSLALQFTVLPLALLTAAFVPKWKKWGFICVVMGLPAIITFCTNMNFSFGNSMMNYAMGTVENGNIYYKGSTEKTARVNYSHVLNTHSAVISMINTVIPSDETYMDLSSHTMLYALTGREKPVYVNQSPLHLSGEYTQIAFINQIKNYNGKCDFALIGGWTGLDGIKNEYRYYKVYEYLNKEFMPLCQSSDGYELWVRKTRYEEFDSKLSGGMLNNIFITKYSAELELLTGDMSRHTYNLGYISYLWGTFDSKKAYNNKVIYDLATEGELPLALQSESNYIKLRLNSAIEGNPVRLILSARDGTPLVNYIFQAKSGEHTYLVRPSSDTLWGTGIIARYSILIGDNINLSGAWLLVGD